MVTINPFYPSGPTANGPQFEGRRQKVKDVGGMWEPWQVPIYPPEGQDLLEQAVHAGNKQNLVRLLSAHPSIRKEDEQRYYGRNDMDGMVFHIDEPHGPYPRHIDVEWNGERRRFAYFA